jgi:2,3-bisphosphoglycerate-independent phosphoglycerate mutase
MKKIVVILDGLGDLPCKQFNGETPLEHAETPNLDELTKKGMLGELKTIKGNIAPQSDSAVIAILGNDPGISSRGQFEAAGMNIKLNRGDLAMRANFGTAENLKGKRMIDRRAGRTLTTKEAKQLAKTLNKEIKLPVKFEFYPSVQHRGVLVFRGGFSDNISDTDTHYVGLNKNKSLLAKECFSWSKALDEEENTEFSANLVNSFVDQSFKILNKHPINQIRRKRGLMPANIVLTRCAGIQMPKVRKFRKAMAIVNMPLEKGICKLSGMDVFGFDYPRMKGYDVYENLYQGLTKMIKHAVKTLKWKGKKYDFAYIHFKETDTPGHDNKPFEKKNFIEMLDKKFFSFLKSYAEKNKLKVIVTGDHSTPCKLKDHSADPLPLLYYNAGKSADKTDKFSEKQAKKGSLGKILGVDLLKRIGFVS